MIAKKLSKYADRIFFLLSDTHGGHKLGLMRKGVKLEEEDVDGNMIPWTPRPNAVQNRLDGYLMEDLDYVVKLADGRPISGVHNGDPTQGNKYPREWVSTRLYDQIAIAYNNLEPIYHMPNLQDFSFVLGTGSHEFGEGSSSYLLKMLFNKEYPDIQTDAVNQYLMDINGCVFDLAHHGPIPGGRRWLEGNGLRWYMNDIQQRDLDLGNAPPDWVVRSHYHTVARTASHYRKGTQIYTTEGVMSPGYTGMDAYGRQATRSKWEVHVGLLAWEISASGMSRLHTKFRILDLRTRKVIT